MNHVARFPFLLWVEASGSYELHLTRDCVVPGLSPEHANAIYDRLTHLEREAERHSRRFCELRDGVFKLASHA